MDKVDKYYVVFVGRVVGVYEKWGDCWAQVHWFSGAKYKSYRSRLEADIEFAKFQKIEAEIQNVEKNGQIPTMGICSDAAYSTKTNILSYRLVMIGRGDEIMRVDFKNFTSKYLTNIGEFFGLVRAIKYVVDRGLDVPIYCDSMVAIDWVERKQVNTVIQEEGLRRMIKGGLDYLGSLKKMPRVIKWDTKRWGEIPADFGNKKMLKKKK